MRLRGRASNVFFSVPGTRAGTQRQIQDKPYFMALIRNKMSELYAEINRLQRENEQMSEEQRYAWFVGVIAERQRFGAIFGVCNYNGHLCCS